jgi:hypothetical protein
MTLTLKKTTVCAAGLLAIAVLLGLYLVGKEDDMSSKVMMYYGIWSPDDNRFDATRWFSSGMYKRRLMGTPAEASTETMLRSKPLPIVANMNDDLVAIAGVALEYDFPEVNTDSLINDPPILTGRVKYWASKFDKPDKPVDLYNLFLNLGQERFVITFSRDAQTGELIDKNSARRVSADQEADAQYVQIFKELDAAGNP